MREFLVQNYVLLLSNCYYGLFVFFVFWQMWTPKRELTCSMPMRWLNNFGVYVVSSVTKKLLVPVTGLVAALNMEAMGFGLFNIVDVPPVLAVVVSILLFDLVDYILHRLSHRIGWVWRIHRVHHADPDFDITTQMRSHPFEALVLIPFRTLAICLLGMPAEAVVLQSLVVNAMLLFGHANIVIPAGPERWLRKLIVTPDMHRIHHSSAKVETDSNFGIIFPWWDRLFGTYVQEPAQGHEGMEVGLERFRSHRDLRLDRLLLLPFRR